MWLSASWGKSTIFCLMNLLKPPLVSPLTPGESGIIRDMNRSAFLSWRKKKKTGGKTHFLSTGTRVNVKMFNINSLSSRTQLGHLYLTHSIGSEWIWIYGPKEGATGWITKWNHQDTEQNEEHTICQVGSWCILIHCEFKRSKRFKVYQY